MSIKQEDKEPLYHSPKFCFMIGFTIFILMCFSPIILIQLLWNSPFHIARGYWSKFIQNDVFLPLKIVFILA